MFLQGVSRRRASGCSAEWCQNSTLSLTILHRSYLTKGPPPLSFTGPHLTHTPSSVSTFRIISICTVQLCPVSANKHRVFASRARVSEGFGAKSVLPPTTSLSELRLESWYVYDMDGWRRWTKEIALSWWGKEGN